MSDEIDTHDERPVPAGDAELCTQAFGDAADPPLLLIMGQMASMLWWPDELCRRLAAAGRFVIRYDNRDTGRSTSYEPGEPPYSVDDLAGDALAVLDGYGLASAHLVGMSMGGAIAQLVALGSPERVLSLTAISTTPIGGDDLDLPGPDAAYMEHAEGLGEVDWSDRASLGEMLVSDSRALAGTRHPFDEAGTRDFVRRDLERTLRPESLVNHERIAGGVGDGTADLAALAVPLLVIHGSADPLLPLAHGAALADAAPDGTLEAIDGGGHELHPGDWDQITAAVAAHTATR